MKFENFKEFVDEKNRECEEQLKEKYNKVLQECNEKYFKKLIEKLKEDKKEEFLELISKFDILDLYDKDKKIIIHELIIDLNNDNHAGILELINKCNDKLNIKGSKDSDREEKLKYYKDECIKKFKEFVNTKIEECEERLKEKYNKVLQECEEEYFKKLIEKLNEDKKEEFLELISKFDILGDEKNLGKLINNLNECNFLELGNLLNRIDKSKIKDDIKGYSKEYSKEYSKLYSEKFNKDFEDFDIINIPSEFRKIILKEYMENYFQKLIKKVNYHYDNSTVFPKKENVFEAFKYKDFYEIKVIILGQDPYHNSKAHGLAFSSSDGSRPKSLKNIFEALKKDIRCDKLDNGNLTSWAKQGVLLLNSILTVSEESGSHENFGWDKFTDKIIKLLSSERENLVFILWGKEAKEKEKLINEDKHKILKFCHPRYSSDKEKFSSCKHFSEANKYLKKYSKGEIYWCKLE